MRLGIQPGFPYRDGWWRMNVCFGSWAEAGTWHAPRRVHLGQRTGRPGGTDPPGGAGRGPGMVFFWLAAAPSSRGALLRFAGSGKSEPPIWVSKVGKQSKPRHLRSRSPRRLSALWCRCEESSSATSEIRIAGPRRSADTRAHRCRQAQSDRSRGRPSTNSGNILRHWRMIPSR